MGIRRSGQDRTFKEGEGGYRVESDSGWVGKGEGHEKYLLWVELVHRRFYR
jgi:hypothetical protein